MTTTRSVASRFVVTVALVTMSLAACSSGTSTEEAPATTGATASTVEATGEIPASTVAGASETTTVATTTVPETTTIAPAAGWVRVPDEEGVFGGDERQAMLAVTAGGPGVVAVGVDGLLAGAVWTSPDGFVWSRVPDDGGAFSAVSGTSVNGVAAGGPGVVAVGGNDDGAAAVWTSADGIAWNLISNPAGSGGAMTTLRSVIATDPGFIAVGGRFSPDSGYGAAVWNSADGVAWTSLPPTAETSPAGMGANMTAITAGGPGYVAVGRTHGEDADAAVWTSTDGLTWTRVPDDGTIFGGPGDQAIQAVGAGATGLVAVGYDTNSVEVGAAVWTSPDGLSWTRIPATLDTFGGVEVRTLDGVTGDGSGFVAVGAVGSGSAIWESPDGTLWTRVPQNDGEFDKDGGNMFGITHAGPGLVVVGQEYSTEFPDAAVWVKASDD